MTKKRKINGNGTSNGNGYHNGNGNGYGDLTPTYKLLREFKPKTKNQSGYIRAIAESDVIICSGPAGCGKTACAVGIACEHLVHGKVNRIVITRPVVEAGNRGIGFLPGTANEKLHPYLLPILDELSVYFSDYEVQKMIVQNVIEVAPLQYMRGRSFHKSFMILDESQNASLDEIKMFITRLGNNSKCVLNGDLRQSDLERNGTTLGMQTCIDRLTNVDRVSIVELGVEDIIRNPIISRILAKLEM
jgi:phosphate starvation-inducible PhoH-like protein